MGQKHREERKRLKAETRTLEAQGWYENEFGELRKRTTKAEARRWLARLRQTLNEITQNSLEAGARLMESLRTQARHDVLDAMQEVITRELDAEILT